MDIQQPATLAESRKAPIVVGSGDWLGRIVCGDNVEVLSGFPAECVDLVVTSPPYDDLRTYGGHSWNFEALAAQLVRVLKPGGVIVWVVADATVNGSETGSSMKQALYFIKLGLNLHDTMIWRKPNPLPPDPDHHRYASGFEFMFVLSKGRPVRGKLLREKSIFAGKHIKRTAYGSLKVNGEKRDDRAQANIGKLTQETKVRLNVWDYTLHGSSEHPAAFPLALAQDHIASWSNPGDVVLDPFSGSGTTCKAAKELNRQWCGIEINPEYCKIAEERLRQNVLQLETI